MLFSIVNSFVRKKVYLLTYLLSSDLKKQTNYFFPKSICPAILSPAHHFAVGGSQKEGPGTFQICD